MRLKRSLPIDGATRGGETNTLFTADQDRERNLELLGEDLPGFENDVPGQPCIEFQLKSDDLRTEDFQAIPKKLMTFKGVSVQDLLYIAEDLRVLLALIDLVRLASYSASWSCCCDLLHVLNH